MPWGFGIPHGYTQDEVNALVEAYTGVAPGVIVREQDLSNLGYLFFHQATTLRERVFARLVSGTEGKKIMFMHTSVITEIHPHQPNMQAFLKACTDNGIVKDLLSQIPHTKPRNGTYANDELHVWLQDLGNLIAEEITQAYTASYYPGLPDVTIPEEHVKEVMKAMQRELYREGDGGSRGHAVQLAELPWERQVALAERRRYWFAQFGIYPETWATGLFSLWDVKEIPMPELRKRP